jgi:hypothetical protein
MTDTPALNAVASGAFRFGGEIEISRLAGGSRVIVWVGIGGTAMRFRHTGQALGRDLDPAYDTRRAIPDFVGNNVRGQ